MNSVMLIIGMDSFCLDKMVSFVLRLSYSSIGTSLSISWEGSRPTECVTYHEKKKIIKLFSGIGNLITHGGLCSGRGSTTRLALIMEGK